MTRFDSGVWLTLSGDPLCPTEMNCSHVMNIIRMCILYPSKILTMCVNDLEDTRMGIYDLHEYRTKLRFFTSRSEEQLIDYFLSSSLFNLMRVRLEKDGVDVKNYVCLCYSERSNNL